MIEPHHHIAAMGEYALADLGGESAVSLAQNESFLPPSPNALKAARDAASDLALYPDPDWVHLRQELGAVHGLSPENILCGAGSMELIGCLLRAYVAANDEIVGTQYGYAFVRTATAQCAATYVVATEPKAVVSVDEILKKITDRTKIVFLCNPGNPTGTRIDVSEVVRLRKALQHTVLLVVDQAYAEFADQDRAAIFDLVEKSPTVVLRTFSKAYGLAGARVGWGVFPVTIAREMRKLLNPNNVSGMSQAAALAALQDQGYMRETVAQTSILRDWFTENLRRLGLDVPQSHTNFVLIGFEDAERAQNAEAALLKAGLVLRGMAGYGLPQCLRATIVERAVLQRVLDILTELQGNRP